MGKIIMDPEGGVCYGLHFEGVILGFCMGKHRGRQHSGAVVIVGGHTVVARP